MNKKESLERLAKLLDNIHSSAREDECSVMRFSRSGYCALSTKAAELELQVLSLPDEQNCFTIDDRPVRALIMDLETSYAALQGRSRRRLAFLGCILFIGLLSAIYNLSGGETHILARITGNPDALMYILLGIGGAIVFFVTEGITDNISLATTGSLTFQTLLARIILAVIIPLIIVVLLFNKNSGIGEAAYNSSAGLCFAAGYSSKLVLLLLNKIVEKGEQIIKAI